MTRTRTILAWLLGLSVLAGPAHAADVHEWSKEEISVLESLWIGLLGAPPPEPSNKYADNPRAAALGKQLFFDSRFSANGQVSCATCHPVNGNFVDERPLARGIGTATRRSMPLVGVAYNAWYFWDGRKDSLWAQALAPLEHPAEHGVSRTRCIKVIAESYRQEYEAIFGPLPALLETDLPARRTTWPR